MFRWCQGAPFSLDPLNDLTAVRERCSDGGEDVRVDSLIGRTGIWNLLFQGPGGGGSMHAPQVLFCKEFPFVAISSGHLNWTLLAGEGIGRSVAGRNNLSLRRLSTTGRVPDPVEQLGRTGPSVADGPGRRMLRDLSGSDGGTSYSRPALMPYGVSHRVGSVIRPVSSVAGRIRPATRSINPSLRVAANPSGWDRRPNHSRG